MDVGDVRIFKQSLQTTKTEDTCNHRVGYAIKVFDGQLVGDRPIVRTPVSLLGNDCARDGDFVID